MVAPIVLVLVLVLWLAGGQAHSADDLSIVRGHYATAAYDEALAHLERLDATTMAPELEQFRAFCLLALGRDDEGRQAFEQLIRRAPFYLIPEADVSPRLYGVFRDVRRLVLPTVVRDLYRQGKRSFDEKRYDTAATELRELTRLLSDPDTAADPATSADLRDLADGFLRLAEAEIALAARAVAGPPEPPAAMPEQEPASTVSVAAVLPPRPDGLVVTKIVVYSSANAEVVPPVELARFMPPWNPPAALGRNTYEGELEIVVDEVGRVQEARMLRPSTPSYDIGLIDATEQWRFEPARRDGETVKYRLLYRILLTPRQ